MPMKFGILFNPLLQGSLIESGVKPTDIAGIGITNQRETTVVWGQKQLGYQFITQLFGNHAKRHLLLIN